jgi:ornithine cyclodeaminase
VVLNSDKIVVDGIDHVLHRETPVIALMIREGKIPRDEILELGAIVCGNQPGRTDADQRVFFSPIGMAIEDVCLCHKVYELAREKGVGTRLGLLGRDPQN